MRRTPEAILTAHEMDPARIELYVEGTSDSLFIRWLAGEGVSPNSLVIEIAQVETPSFSQGGERARLIAFASKVEQEPAHIRIFADADFDRMLDRTSDLPANTWLTDGRDLESYFIREECFEKITKLAIGTDLYTGGQLLTWLSQECRILGFLRLLSETEGLALPFQNTRLRRHVSFASDGFEVDLETYLAALLNNSNRSLAERRTILASLEALQANNLDIVDTEIIHGKDTIRLLAEALLSHGLPRESSQSILRVSFDRVLVGEYPVLSQVVGFISRN